MSFDRRFHSRALAFSLAGACAVLGVATTAFGGMLDGIAHRPPARVRAIAAHLRAPQDFAVPLNADVLREWNHFVGTEEGRRFVRRGKARMERYRPMVEAKMRQYGVPRALLAIPFVETGWRNFPPGPPYYGVGLWQFVRTTARAYGLRVDEKVDERLDVAKATDAAMRLLARHHRRFRNWGLAIVAYNGGEGATRRAVASVGRNPWKVVGAGAEATRGYLARVYALALVLAEPAALVR